MGGFLGKKPGGEVGPQNCYVRSGALAEDPTERKKKKKTRGKQVSGRGGPLVLRPNRAHEKLKQRERERRREGPGRETPRLVKTKKGGGNKGRFRAKP